MLKQHEIDSVCKQFLGHISLQEEHQIVLIKKLRMSSPCGAVEIQDKKKAKQNKQKKASKLKQGA